MTPGDPLRVNYGLFNPRLQEATPSMPGQFVREYDGTVVVQAKGFRFHIDKERNKRLRLVQSNN